MLNVAQIIVASVLGGLIFIALAAICIQGLLSDRRKPVSQGYFDYEPDRQINLGEATAARLPLRSRKVEN